MAAPLILTATFGDGDNGWLQQMRRDNYPPALNRVPAHLTLFHALPPSAEAEVRSILSCIAKGVAPKAILEAPYSLGNGVAYRIRSPGLHSVRDEIAERFHGLLTAQDSAGWRPHVTVQNKVSSAAARALLAQLLSGFEARPLGIRGLSLDRYAGGPWEPIAKFPFRG